MAGWHHWLDRLEFEWTPGVGDGEGGLACCDSWGSKGLDTTERLNWTELKYKSRKSRNTWSNRQIWSWSRDWSRTKANRVLPRECTGHSKHPLLATQEKTLHMDLTRWSTPKSDWLYSLQPKMEKLYTVNKNKIRSWVWLRSWTPYCQIQTQIEQSRENRYTIQIWPKSNPLWLCSGSEK